MTSDADSHKRPEPLRWHSRLRACEPRAVAVQATLLILIAAFAAFLASNLAINVARLNLHIGFGFLARPAGFQIAQTPIAYPEDATYFRAFLVALVNTIMIATVSI